MADRQTLIDAVLDAYDNAAYQPVFENGQLLTTFCNVAVDTIAEKMGCKDFGGMDADDMFLWMVQHPSLWQEITCSTLPVDQRSVAFGALQSYANAGELVIAAATSTMLGQSHGHVVVIRPGILVDSGKWGLVPRCLNIGREVFIARGKSGPMKNLPVGINEAFVELPRFFVWKGPD